MRLFFRASALALAVCAPCALAMQATDPAPAPTPAPTPAPAPAQPGEAAPAPAPEPLPFAPLAHVERRGTGPIPMILVPGLACDWTVFDAFMTRNTERYTMHAVTLPGNGGSEPPGAVEGRFGEQPWLANAEEAIVRYAREQGLDKPVVVGHSIGGHLALRLGLHHADQFRAVVSLDGAGAFPLGDPSQPVPPEQRVQVVEGMVAPQLAMMDQETWKAQMEGSAAGMVTNPERAAAIGAMCGSVPVATAGRYMLELLASDLSESLKANTARALVVAAINAEENAMVPNQVIRDWWTANSGSVPNTTLVFFEATRHFITEDAPAELDRALEQFLAGQPVEGKEAPEPAPDAAPAAPDAPAAPAPPPAPTPKPPEGSGAR